MPPALSVAGQGGAVPQQPLPAQGASSPLSPLQQCARPEVLAALLETLAWQDWFAPGDSEQLRALKQKVLEAVMCLLKHGLAVQQLLAYKGWVG